MQVTTATNPQLKLRNGRFTTLPGSDGEGIDAKALADAIPAAMADGELPITIAANRLPLPSKFTTAELQGLVDRATELTANPMADERVVLDLNAAEVAQLKQRAAAAALPLRRWARRTLLGTPTPAAQPAELREIWSRSSSLQSNTNQLCERLNQLHLNGDLNRDSADQTLRELALLAPDLHQLVRQMRVELANLKGCSR